MNDNIESNVLVILVAFNPDWNKVFKRLASFSGIGHVFISDNSRVDNSLLFKDESVSYHYNDGNIGIAKAQNIGIKYALQHRYSYIAFVDDDSDLTGDKLAILLKNYHSLYLKNNHIAAYCASPSEVGGFDKKQKSPLGPGLYLANNLMSSGSITRSDVFKELGLFDERLFIDFVDYEWGWRAVSAGYSIIIDTNVNFKHSLGIGKTRYGLGIPSPIRHYYQTRNLLWIMHLKYVPFMWKLKQILLLPVRFIYFGFFYIDSKDRRANFLKGLLAGLKRVS